MPVLRSVLCSGLSGQREAKGLWPRGVPERSETSGPASLVCEESRLLSGAISLCQGMAAEEESRGPALRLGDDTRQVPPGETFTEADFTDPGGNRGHDTRQDRPSKAEPAHVCGLWIRKGAIQDTIDLPGKWSYDEIIESRRRRPWSPGWCIKFGSFTKWKG